MGEGVQFRPQRSAQSEVRGALGMAITLLVVAVLLFTRELWTPRVAQGALIEVQGEVAVPGWHVVSPPTLAAAVEAAGGDSEGLPETALLEGDLVMVDPDGVRVAPSGDPLLVSLPVDPNTHGAAGLSAIPGVSRRLAEAMVASRREHGLFQDIEDLRRVPGVGDATLEKMRPFLKIDVALARRVDINRADSSALERLPGIGPALAARIVKDRQDHGPFHRLGDLTRVRGVGTATVERLSAQATVGDVP